MLNDALLNDHMKVFYGYGSWKAKYWFVGIEEGGGKTFEEVKRRLDTWDRRGRRDIEDIREFLGEAGLGDWFGTTARMQSTWGSLIRALLTAQNKNANDTSVLDYQRLQFGGLSGETAVVENLPLPSPGRRDWNYDRWSSLEVLRTRREYERAFLKPRADHIVSLIRLHEPKAVIFYGNRETWSQRFNLVPTESSKTKVGPWRETLLIATDQPTAHTNDAVARFTAIGKMIAEKAQP